MPMYSLNDLMLLVIVFSSMAAGIFFPRFCASFRPFPLYLMMLLLFFSFISIRVGDIKKTMREHPAMVLSLFLLKIFVLPAGVYFLLKFIYPDYAVAGLLITGISTGVVAPFMSNILGANSPLVLVMVVITSVAVPFSLPGLVRLLAGQELKIPLFDMIRMLGMVIFVPFAAAEILRKISMPAIEIILRCRFYLSLIIFAVINLGVFSKYSDFFLQSPQIIFEALIVSLGLGALFLVAGIAYFWRKDVEDQIAAAISLCNMNNLLVIVFASRFFGPLEPTLAALYMVPFFLVILPLRLYRAVRSAD